MAGISADLINPFLMAATSVMKDICQTDMSIGKPYVKKTEFEDETVAIMIGITGEMKGQVLMAFSYANALNIASRMMMGMPVTELDDMATRGIVIDITPPTVCQGSMTITQTYAQNICVPIQAGDGLSLELDIAIKTE